MTYIGILGAMDEEIKLLLEQMEEKDTQVQAGIRFITGTLLGRNVVVSKSGVGKVNAAATTQLMIDRFQVSSVLFTGVAGAVNPKLQIGDIVISSSCQQHDMDVTALGYERGIIPYQEISDFPADDSLVKLAMEACEKVCKDHQFLVGRVLSGDRFVADRDVVQDLYESMHGACVEMEGAAVAQVCHMNNVPYVVLRSMSDKADGSAHVNFAEFTVEAANRSYAILNEMIGSL
ncbi:5'-methylthioadenosine/adenosylhomocysteine nucleosidase [Paenibacillus physcomitrellae]|uniref:adenosylhomocysteine nucleosidase n=1 Tax=Paenibacillus physcomitrellae TaxID=1619311 RepID=A0ABQ1FNZ9_9BACL|nr:5'-methylthioadenosine/adenosylhomocysteine nucleosidase [Paenibacillus physcomitrellae]GGA21600.1 5'-methylthioadenosine/S-adenosylhomocysteine nucleosidase [Paenibacillus physcomitrellae]